MASAKLSVKWREFEFSGEGEAEWLSGELEKAMQSLEKVVSSGLVDIAGPTKDSEGDSQEGSEKSVSLAKFLKDKNATSNQNRKFLATSVWYHKYKNKKRLVPNDVTVALKEANQSRLGNASECLAQNVKAGDIEKDGREFFVTHDGFEKLGVPNE